MNPLYSNHQIETVDQSRAPNTLANQGGKVENAYLRVRTTTANVGGVLPGPAHQASDSKFHQWCHERRLSPEVGQWLIYMIAGTWVEHLHEGPRRRLYIRLG